MAKEEKKAEAKVKRPSAQKRVLQSEKHRLRNKSFKSNVRSVVRKFHESLDKNNPTEAKHLLKEVYSLMDKGVKNGIFKLNKANRTKSRLTAHAARGAAA